MHVLHTKPVKMKAHALCVIVFAIASASNIEDRLSRLEATVQTLSDALKSLTNSSVHSKPLVEHAPIEQAPVEQDAVTLHRRELATPSTKPCARFRNFHGNDVHGNHYLNTVWVLKTFGA